MEEKTIKVYSYDELSDDAKVKALDDYNENDNDYDFLSEVLNEQLNELLEEAKINNSDDAKLYYSLSNCQGDGVCFEGNFVYKGVNINVKHDGHYYHSNSVDIEAEQEEYDDDLKNDVNEAVTNEAEADFKEAFKEICDKIEKMGYAEIEHQESEEAFKDYCEANERTFLDDGTSNYY